MKLYFEAEKYLRSSGNERGSLQSRIFNEKSLTNSPKHVFALVISTLKYKEYIVKVIKASKLKASPIIKKLRVTDEMLWLLTHDLLFQAKGRIQSGKHPIKDAFLQHKTRLTSELIKLKLKYKIKSVEEFPNLKGQNDETPIRWFRVNQIKITTAVFFEKYDFFKKLQPVSDISEITSTGFLYQDDFVPNLYGVHNRELIMKSDAYAKGELIIQDRASCFPGHILFNDPQFQPTHIIDACAAPGNKTTHTASYLYDKPSSVVYAFERDNKRVEILKKMCNLASNKPNLIQITHADFTSVNPNDFKDIEALVVDPSCSGSGIFGRAIEDSLEQHKEEISTERLNKLSRFQFSIMKHALSFPGAKKVVYSTCSIHAEENERVVVDLLLDENVKKAGWTLAPRNVVISTWPRRGWPQEFTALQEEGRSVGDLAGGCVRAVAKEDGGIGFFAACFVRREAASRGEGEEKEEQEQELELEDELEEEEQEEEQEEEDWTGFGP
ncbi:RsmB/NOP family class I SAM-dependent RNA methyltransferase [Yamadazyma tenuis]|uniref:SAM-dependent MTase RsmB/NOP-type domain-containing protein n=1 Tax=Candida tenuis (strain ATCC 10573 / BCRC 21748 / CBS 615 / JCM 9827 / NBRC 10315 / NRRL Y-1498 / VKM Y-70) TaxID=590646 RepID=G3AXW5_CANTC|nr:uncharacterized protein CANTEDRAFT_101870 [Yamadazyma tenuis ATCC 10573]EGV65709.1 hypothetical protein CANTEDRAFT_101870 [Yamadazyma tenuis ATCC 10573]WEJ95974.1 RsmB/NOP family class I SAM-dependent RNA methyltransferase [Yamadazyma tenuis]